MFDVACHSAAIPCAAQSAPVAIVATGGYGRRELCPHSDLDITFIPARDGDPAIDRLVKEMFTALMKVLMDSARMEVGYAYRLLEDCGALDHQTVSGLLDARLIAGSTRLFIRFEHEFWSNFNPAEFIFAKLDERRRQRHAAGGTPRTVEPELKTGPGGLRDLQAAVWLVQAREGLTAATVRGDRVWDVLQRRGAIPPEQSAALRASKEFLFRTRNALHALAGQERDQLVVTRQEDVARALGYTEEPNAPPPVERFMRELYGRLVAVDQIADEVAHRMESSRLFMGIGLDCVKRQLTPANPSLAAEDPVWMVWACELAQRFDLTFSPELRHEISHVLARAPVTSEPARLGELVTAIVSSRRPIYPILQAMADAGILQWVLPDVGVTMDMIPYEASHDYTVGQHSLFVLQHLDELRSPACPEELREFQVLMAELTAPEQLYLAALFHDAGKTVPDAPHWDTGAGMARRACAMLGWKDDATANVVFLVQHHLLMAETSRLRDLGMDETIREFIAVVDDPERLRMLYLLTYADTRAVSRALWTQVKARYLQDLYRRAERALSAGIREAPDDVRIMRTRRRLAKELEVENLPAEEVSAHLEGMPAEYVLNTDREEMALHIAFARQARAGLPSVSFHDDRLSTFTEVTICALDDPRPGLLAKIAGVLYAADVTVHAAQVFTRVSGEERIALDTLCVDFRGRRLSSGKRSEIEGNLVAVLSGTTTVEKVLSKRRKPADMTLAVEQIRVRGDFSERLTVVELAFTAPQGMLFHASRALSELGWDIQSARMSRFRGRAMAAFYVSGARGLADDAVREALERHLAARVA